MALQHDVDGEMSITGSVLRAHLVRKGDFTAKEITSPKRRLMKHFSTLQAAPLLDPTVNLGVQSHIAAFLYFEEPLPVEEFRAVVQKRLFELPRFRSRIVAEEDGSSFFEQMEPREIDMKELVREVGNIKSAKELNTFVSEVCKQPMDLLQPQWRCFIINNLEDGRHVLCWVVHHSIGDGTSLVAALLSMLDDSEQPAVAAAKPAPAKKVGCWAGVMATLRALKKILLDGSRDDAQHCLRIKDPMNPDFHKAMACSGSIELDRVKQVKEKIPNATVHDVLMATCCMTLRSYFLTREPELLEKPSLFRTDFPVNMRRHGEDPLSEESFGNAVSTAQAELPLHLSDPLEIFRHLKAQIDDMKISGEPQIRGALCAFLLKHNQKKQKEITKHAIELMSKCSMVLSNVPGPATPAFLCGRRISDMQFFIFQHVYSLVFSIISYNRKVSVGIMTNESSEPQPENIANLWVESFEKLHATVMAQ